MSGFESFHRDTSPPPSHAHPQPVSAASTGNLTQSPGGGTASKPRSTPPHSSPPQNHVCVCMYVCMYVCPLIEVYYMILSPEYVCMYAYMHCVYIRTHVYMYACIYVCMYDAKVLLIVLVCNCSMYVCMYVCIGAATIFFAGEEFFSSHITTDQVLYIHVHAYTTAISI